MKLILICIALISVLVLAGCKKIAPTTTANQNQQSTQTTQQQTQTQIQNQKYPTPTFDSPKKSAHYVSNSPNHGSIQSTAPQSVSINFNFDLALNSTISIVRDGQEYSSGPVTISSDKRTLGRSISATATEGLYTVNYKACWPDGSCHEGNFQFAIVTGS